MSPKFLICENPFPGEGETSEFVLHNHFPRFLSKVEELDFDELEEIPEKPFYDVLYINSEGVMEIYRLETTDIINKAKEEDDYDDILFQANEFYVRYLQELEKLDGNKPGFPVKDFSKEMPGLKILHSSDRWTIVYNGLVADFHTEEEMDEFLEKDLEIPESLLDKGIINNFE